MIDDLRMLTQKEVCELLNANKETLIVWRDLGILNPIKTGRNYMFSQSEIARFQRDYTGYDLSNRFNAIQSLKEIETKKHQAQLNNA